MPRTDYAALARASERELLITILANTHAMEAHMSRLDDSVQNLTTAITTFRGSYDAEVAALRAKLAAAQADDSLAADVAADVEENLGRLDTLTASLGTSTPPADPTDGATTDGDPADGQPTDGATPANGDPTDGVPAPSDPNA